MRFAFILLSVLALFSLAFWFQPASPQIEALLVPTATTSPTVQPENDPIPESGIVLTLYENRPATYQILSEEGVARTMTATVIQRSNVASRSHPVGRQVTPKGPEAIAADFVDNWEVLLPLDDIEGAYPPPGCTPFDNNPGDELQYFWGDDTHRSSSGSWAVWPAKDGADGLDPASTNYPPNMNSWLVCGPYDMSQAQTMLIRFARWLEINDPEDAFFAGVSTNGGATYTGVPWSTVADWVAQTMYINGVAGEAEVYVGWLFSSDDDDDRAEGAWIDDLEILRYNNPAQTCGDADPGAKGAVLSPYVDEFRNIPTIRADDTTAVTRLVAANAKWVRLGFQHRAGFVRQEEYDRMVDTLCASGISVLGLVNHETLSRQDINDPVTAVSYRQEFAGKTSDLVTHFQGRITYWEVWNEPNYEPEPGIPPFIRPSLYAPLLNDTHQAIKDANSEAQVLFGGLGSAWGDSNDYFQQVYGFLGSAKPFDYFAVHPYPNEIYGPNPTIYMYAVDQPDEDTIVDKFMRTMAGNGDGNKTVWITEIGWNASKHSPGRPLCHESVLVTKTEQANYLKPSFDTLFTEVDLWGAKRTRCRKSHLVSLLRFCG